MTNRTFKSGESREQGSLLPARVEDYVGSDNPARAIESFVCALDLAKFGFCHADRGAEEMGQPPYDPADLLKLYLATSTVVWIAIDGSFFHGDASKASIFTRKRLTDQIAKLDQEIEAYGKSVEDNDAAEARKPGRDRLDGDGGGADGGDIGVKVAALMARRSQICEQKPILIGSSRDRPD